LGAVTTDAGTNARDRRMKKNGIRQEIMAKKSAKA